MRFLTRYYEFVFLYFFILLFFIYNYYYYNPLIMTQTPFIMLPLFSFKSIHKT